MNSPMLRAAMRGFVKRREFLKAVATTSGLVRILVKVNLEFGPI